MELKKQFLRMIVRMELDQLSNIRGSREEGLKKGMEKKEREMIQKMLEKGMSVADIAHILDMTEEEVRNLLKD